MEEYTVDKLNEIAMQMIMFAGNGRDKISKALVALETDFDFEAYDNLMKDGHNDIVKAHQLQTQVIQATIEDEDMKTTLLFSHGQDTLMTINTEYNLAKHIGKLYRVVKKCCCGGDN